MDSITKNQLKQISSDISDKNLEIYTPLLNEAFKKYEINTTERISCFLAQILHESGSFKYVKEIASGKAYEGRLDLGNTQVGDGVKFKGRGLIQTTGRTNYRKVSLFLFKDERLLESPEILEDPKYALDSACFYWQDRNLNYICDKPNEWVTIYKGKTYNKFKWLTIKINGGLNGIDERFKFYHQAKKVLSGTREETNKINDLAVNKPLEDINPSQTT